MPEKTKQAMFNKMLELYHLSEAYCSGRTHDGRNYFEQAEGAYEMLVVLGINDEYTRWSIGK